LSAPLISGGTVPAYFGPNFTYTSAAVPEPASLTMFGLGAVVLVAGAIRRRRQTNAAV